MSKNKLNPRRVIKIPFQLTKRLSDGPVGEMRFQIEIPDKFIKKAIELDLYKQMFFVMVGPLESEAQFSKV